MNRFFKMMMAALMVMGATTLFAQSKADRLVGVYAVVEEGKESKVRFTKEADGSYKGQIFWLKNATEADGTPKLDKRNPDPKKSCLRADQVVVVWGVRYDAEKDCWSKGRVYNPATGKEYNCTVSFDDEQTLRVRGSIGPVGLSRYWKKIE